ncbi:zinc finger MYM-type protein 1-like [Rhinoderma darwinii]|uniref:zinc finger MYM-type protein 1-like n=1 Tax=Rhinoderma darwinii TaxID=43563 RepID=UPI003F66CD01
MAMANLAFRGHREKLGEVNNGNFLTIIELLAEYDPILKDHLQRPQGTVKYLSPQIQNELISLLASKVEEEIISEIQKSQFYSIIMDTTQDIGKIDQLSQVIRYVVVERDENFRATSIKIEEAFLGFQSVEDQSAAGLEKPIIESIEKKGLDLSKCRGQGYDGAATMSGIYTGVQARILSKEKNALYIHCAAHNLNLVLHDAVSNIPEIAIFFDNVQSLYTFFGDSVKRWAFLASFTSESSITLKQLCPTRWASRYDSVLALRFRFQDILKALSKIIIISTKPKERDEASALKAKMESFHFIFIIVLQAKVLENVNLVSKMLQSKDMDLCTATKLVDNATQVLSDFRNNYDEAKRTAITLAETWSIQAKFVNKRVKKVKRHFDELCLDERLQDPKERFKTTVFYQCLDIAINQLQNRFSAMNTVLQRFKILQPATLSGESDDVVFKEATKLQDFYQDDLSNDFPGQLLSFWSALPEDIKRSSSVRDLATGELVDSSGLASTLPDVCIALLLFLTLPVTVASAERSFSKLKLIKNYLRSTMSQQKLSHLALLSVENERARKLDIQSMIDKFSEAKARRHTFQ